VSGRWPIPHAKTAIPRLPASFVSRVGVRQGLHRLVSRYPVSLVCAPAGYGKTLLLADWVDSTGASDKIWISLDADDNNADRFWTVVANAVHKTTARPSEVSLAARGDTAGLLAEVIDSCAAGPEPLHLILDDVHEVISEETLHGIATLVQHQPDNLRLVLSTRADPPLPLARLRLQGRLAEYRARELRFSHEDAATLIRIAGVPLTDGQVSQLVEQTDGWAAGLRLAARSLRDVADRDAFLADFASNDHTMADYLVSEVLTRLPAATREFLQVVSVCDEVTAVLAAVLSGRSDAGGMLAALERESSLMMGVGPDRQWYRMHPLLRSYLQADLARQRPNRAAELHATAAAWFAAREQPGKAFDHAARTGEPATSVGLLRRYAMPLLMTGDHRTVRRALTLAGTRVVARDPWLALVSALVHVESCESAKARADLADSRSAWPAEPDEDLLSLRRLVAATETLTSGFSTASEPVDWRALASTAQGGDLEAWARLGLGWALLRTGQRRAARDELEVAERLARGHGFDYLTVHCLVALGVLSGLEGAYDAMETACAESVAIAGVHGWRRAPGLAMSHALVGFARLMRLDHVSALEQARRAAAAVADPEPRHLRYLIDFVTGAASFDADDRTAGLRLMERARKDLGDAGLPAEVLVGGALIEQRSALELGQDTLAQEVVNWTRATAGTTSEVSLMHAWTSLARDDVPAAEAATRDVLDHSLPTLWPATRLEARLLETALEIRHGRRTRARSALGIALSMAEPASLIRPFHQADPSVRQLLREQIGGFGRTDGFAARVSRAVSAVEGQPDGRLTNREQAVLARLSSPQSLDELASDMTVSVNTVKTHVRAIYAKLGVNNRRAAVVAGRQLGLA
jgi:LuxR family maltose regulon positive regulatory protein